MLSPWYRAFVAGARQFIAMLVAVSAVGSVMVAEAQVGTYRGENSDSERVQRARQILKDLSTSSCFMNERCASLMGETKRSMSDVNEALGELDQALGEAGRLRNQIAALTQERQRAAQDAEAMQKQLDSLAQTTVDKAAVLLASRHFGLPVQNAAELLRKQLEEPPARFKCGGQEVIVTLFGYFIHDPEVDVSHGAKLLKLSFHPMAFPGSVGRVIDDYAKSAQITIEPRLKVAATSIQVEPARQGALSLTSANEWLWTLKQPWWSAVSETEGAITPRMTSPQTPPQDGKSLMVKVKGSPWWWPAKWFWENVLSQVQAWSVGAVVAVVAWQQGVRGALLWIWRWVKRKAEPGGQEDK
jgi:hypothetical protein